MIPKKNNEAIVPYSDRKKGLALRLEEAPLERQAFFKANMTEAGGHGPCEWCDREMGRRWNWHPRGAHHHKRRPDGLIMPLKMCYQCCELELAEPPSARLPEPESLHHPVGPIIVDGSASTGKRIIRAGE